MASTATASEQQQQQRAALRSVWRTLQRDTHDFWTDARMPVFDSRLQTSTDFARDVYSRYQPALLQGLTACQRAQRRWSRQSLCLALGDKTVSVNLTPHGRADSVRSVRVPRRGGAEKRTRRGGKDEELDLDADAEVDIQTQAQAQTQSETEKETNSEMEEREHFVYPAEVQMTMSEFYRLLVDEKGAGNGVVPYLSQQNDNLREQFPELVDDIDLVVPLAQEVFGTDGPEAVNLWIGDERSVSSMHKDHFENLYFVISGEKTFTLLPPTDVFAIPENIYPTARYVAVEDVKQQNIADRWKLSLTEEGCPADELRWTPVDPEDPESVRKYPKFQRYAHPIHVTVCAGECLYIPAMWYHRVSQNTLTVSVNYWYDQRFDFRYVFFKTIQSMMLVGDVLDEIEDEDESEEFSDHDGL